MTDPAPDNTSLESEIDRHVSARYHLSPFHTPFSRLSRVS